MGAQSDGMHFNLRQAVFALSDALDLVGIDDRYHGKRVAMMAVECARHLDWPAAARDRLLQEAILHDLGVSSTRTHQRLVSELDWHGARVHCEVGRHLLSQCPVLAFAAPAVQYHHTHWDALVRDSVSGDVALHANLIFLADRVDALVAMAAVESPYLARRQVIEELQRHRDTMFSAELIDAFAEVSRPEAFWLRLEPPHLLDYFDPWLQSEAEQSELGFDSFHSIALLFSNCVDAKSEFTAEHSAGVARLAGQLGQWFGLPAMACQKLEIAGLLHDIGKLRVPDEILDKPGPLDGPERDVMERHSFDSQYILGRIGGLEDVALWASQHHEKLDGDGYPFRADGAVLSPEARILTVADIYQALAQDRPYRAAMSADTILEVLRGLVVDGKVDGEIVDLVEHHADACYHLARGSRSTA